MRNAFATEITRIASEDEKVVLLSGDIGNKVFDNFKESAPDRFMNCGISEANMIGTAAGMAMCGFKPVVYTIAPFTTSRCFEQIKLDVCYHNVPVVIVGVGAGLSYAPLGATHHAFEDIAILRVLPRLSIVCPGDPTEVKLAIREAISSNIPTYIRLGKKGEKVVHDTDPAFEIGKAITVKDGDDICILSTGNLLPLAMECASKLKEQSISAKVVSFHTVKPMDLDLLEKVFTQYPVVATLEEHSVIGGLGSSIAEWRAKQHGDRAQLMSFGIDDSFLCETGSQNYARRHFGLSAEQIVPKLTPLLK